MANGGRIRGADPLTLGLARGIPAGIENFIRFQELGLRKGKFAREEEEFARKKKLDAALPDFLRKFLEPEGGGGSTLPATPADAFAPSPAAGRGGAEGFAPGGPLAAGLQGGRSATPTPGGPRSLADSVRAPGGAEALIGLQQGGVNPVELISKIKAEDRMGEGRKKMVEGIEGLRIAETPEQKLVALGNVLTGGVLMGQIPDMGAYLDFIKTEEERAEVLADLTRLEKNLFPLMTADKGRMDPIEETRKRFDAADDLTGSQSRLFRTVKNAATAGVCFNTGGKIGSNRAFALKIYCTMITKGIPPEQAWAAVEKASPKIAAEMVDEGSAPRIVTQQRELELERRSAQAKAEGKRAAVPAAERELDTRGKKARIEAAEALASVRKANASGEIKSTKDAIRAIATLASAELSMSFSLGEEDTVVKEEIARMKADIIRQSADLRKRQQEKGKASPQEEIRRKATDVMNKLFPGKNFQDLTPEEKQFVVNAVNEGA